MHNGYRRVAIRITNDADLAKAYQEFIYDNPQWLVADLPDGYFVVLKDALPHLKKKGIQFKPVELVVGVPKEVREFTKRTYQGNGVCMSGC